MTNARVVCGCFGTIYYAKLLKDGLMSNVGRVDVTEDAITAVMNHLMTMNEYKKNDGFAGYEYGKRDGDGSVVLAVYDKKNYKLVKREEAV